MNRREVIKALGLITGGVIVGPQSLLYACTKKGTPSILSKEQFSLLEEISETILPKTEKSPGAKDAKVAEFIDIMINDYYKPVEQKALIEGLEEYKLAGFLSLSKGEKLNYLLAKEKEARKTPRIKVVDAQGKTQHVHHPYSTYKKLTLLGYRTSEIIAKTVFEYAPIPGTYDPCVEVTKDTKLMYK